MRVILQPTELKVLVRAIYSLGKLGHEIYFECGRNDLKIKTVNSSRSAFAVIQFKETFFDKFTSSLADGSSQRFKIPSIFAGEVINNFRQSSDELTFILNDGECTFQNHTFQTDPSTITTQIPLNATEFDVYIIQSKCEVTFCQKELRVLLPFCEFVSPMIRIYCDQPGKPIIFACAHETRLTFRAYSPFLSNRTPVPLQRFPASVMGENIQNDDTVLVSKESDPSDVMSKRCKLSQANEFTNIRSDVNATFAKDQCGVQKVKHFIINSHHDHNFRDEIPPKKVHSALFANFQSKETSYVEDNTKTTELIIPTYGNRRKRQQ
ncbi:unnamed protein product [Heterobilharzia americana]|nr:unnamed protein product [Heterobilharzia americana]